MSFTHIVGARPNFMKAAPVMAALKRRGATQVLVHTGQHYDELMSSVMFRQLGLPAPDVNLAVGSGSHAAQTAAVMTALEPVLDRQRPSVLVVYGDVNSTLAAALVGAKAGIPIAHVEAGVRSFDRSMPEEINRLVADRVSTYLLAPSEGAVANLIDEGHSTDAIHNVGNVMIDALKICLPAADASRFLRATAIDDGEPYLLVTLHRAGNVDDDGFLDAVMTSLVKVSREICHVIFPVHPRTRSRLRRISEPRLHLTEPAGYLEFIDLQRKARVILTDSGGVQVEAAHLGVPCLTLRLNTEWTDTVAAGANMLLDRDAGRIVDAVATAIQQTRRASPLPANWDGHAAERIADVLVAAIKS
jgi:UDP-N-acetylglucosamine 2-epimerase (non-hydrolysing)